jgi:glycerophosphoryl diester phosphodiesterase
MGAFLAALDVGADGFELDVRLSADGVPVVIHDASLLRTTGLRGRVAERTAAELAEIVPRARSIAGNGGQAGVPTLDEPLDLAAARGATVYVELKGKEHALADAVVARLSNRGSSDRVVLLSFDHAALRRVRAIDERIATAATFAPSIRAPRISPAKLVERVLRAEANEAALHVSLATKRRVAALRERGLGVSVWTVNSLAVARRVAAIGVDAVMTDFPERLVGALAAR